MSIVEITFAQGPLAAEAPSGTPGGMLGEIAFDAVAWDGERPITGGGGTLNEVKVASDYPLEYVKQGKAAELKSKVVPA